MTRPAEWTPMSRLPPARRLNCSSDTPNARHQPQKPADAQGTPEDPHSPSYRLRQKNTPER